MLIGGRSTGRLDVASDTEAISPATPSAPQCHECNRAD